MPDEAPVLAGSAPGGRECGGTDPWRAGYGNMAEDTERGSSRRLEDQIRERAYHLWEEEGRPEGRAEIHWAKARALIEGDKSQAAAAEAAEDPNAGDPADDRLDEQLKDSFPASDAPSNTPSKHVGGPDRAPRRRRRRT
jgi:hypothetical protein